MLKSVLIAAALTATLVLSACNKPAADQQSAQVQQLQKPTDVNDSKAWSAYLGQLVQSNLKGMKAAQPYAYMVTAGATPDDIAKNERQLGNVTDVVSRGVLPGNLLAFAGPVSSKTADLLLAAFAGARPGSFKDVTVLFIGDKADEQRVDDALKPTGATVHFVAM
ncbi:MAG: hypothetical protein ABI114_17910 [Rhodanobacter sp.]